MAKKRVRLDTAIHSPVPRGRRPNRRWDELCRDLRQHFLHYRGGGDRLEPEQANKRNTCSVGPQEVDLQRVAVGATPTPIAFGRPSRGFPPHPTQAAATILAKPALAVALPVVPVLLIAKRIVRT
jgi:hypothetical protein